MLMVLESKTNQNSAFSSVTLYLIELKISSVSCECIIISPRNLCHAVTFKNIYAIVFRKELVNVFLMRLNCTVLKDLMLAVFMLM